MMAAGDGAHLAALLRRQASLHSDADLAYRLQVAEAIQASLRAGPSRDAAAAASPPSFQAAVRPCRSGASVPHYRILFKGMTSKEALGPMGRDPGVAVAVLAAAVVGPLGDVLFKVQKPVEGFVGDRKTIEVMALMEGLHAAHRLGIRNATILTDYLLLRNHMLGYWRPKKKLADMIDQVTSLRRQFFDRCEIALVEHSQVSYVFKLARDFIDAQISKALSERSERCNICLEDTEVSKIHAVEGCAHRFCLSCMKKHVTIKLLHGTLPSCPRDGCTSKLTVEGSKVFLSPQLLEIMAQRIRKEQIPPTQRIYCPYPKCSAVMSLTELMKPMQGTCSNYTVADVVTLRKCVKCRGSFCFRCKVPWHDRMTCNDYKRRYPQGGPEDSKLQEKLPACDAGTSSSSLSSSQVPSLPCRSGASVLHYRILFKGMTSKEVLGPRDQDPGVAVLAAAVVSPLGDLLFRVQKPVQGFVGGRKTIEVMALMEGLHAAIRLGIRSATILTDYILLHNHMLGYWCPKKKLADMIDQVMSLRGQFDRCEIILVEHSQVSYVFKLARDYIDAQFAKALAERSEKCSICLEDTEVSKIHAVEGCAHRFCMSCMKEHVRIKLLHGTLPSCPQDGCTSKLTVEGSKVFLSPQLLETLAQRIREEQIPPTQKIYCPYPKCSALMCMSELMNPMQGTCSKYIVADVVTLRKCVKCRGSFCFRCKVPWHDRMTCNDYKRRYPHGRPEDAKLQNLAQQRLWRQCVRCRHMIEFAEGCYHMTCVCGYEFCYTCGSEWKEKKATCTCPLWEERIIVRYDNEDDEDDEDEDYYDNVVHLPFPRGNIVRYDNEDEDNVVHLPFPRGNIVRYDNEDDEDDEDEDNVVHLPFPRGNIVRYDNEDDEDDEDEDYYGNVVHLPFPRGPVH